MKKAVLIISPNNFRDEELFDTKEELESSGIETKIASKTTDTAKGMLGGTAKPDMTIDDISVSEYDAVVLIGGSGSSVYFNDAKVQLLVKEAFSKGKVVAAICIAPSTLANAGILKGKKATCYPSEGSNLKAKGAMYTASSVEIDGKIITANGPGAASAFGRAITAALR